MKWSSAAVIYYRGITSLDNGQFHPLKQNIAKSLLVKKSTENYLSMIRIILPQDYKSKR